MFWLTKAFVAPPAQVVNAVLAFAFTPSAGVKAVAQVVPQQEAYDPGIVLLHAGSLWCVNEKVTVVPNAYGPNT